MTPLLTLDTLRIIARETIPDGDEWALYCIDSASTMVADEAGHPDWIGYDALGNAIPPVAAPRRAVMIAEQLAMRSFKNPDAVVSEGNVGPLGGDRTVEEFARTFTFTQMELDYLERVNTATGITGGTTGGLYTLTIDNAAAVLTQTIYLPDLDPLADSWPMGTEGVDNWAYDPIV